MNKPIQLNDKNIHPDVKAVIEHYKFGKLHVEGMFYKSTYQSPFKLADDGPVGTAIIGMYSNLPLSISRFHKLRHEEIWHVYAGDPFILELLHEDGSAEQIIMGNNPLKGQHVQYIVPANTWQAGYLIEGGRFALFGCTMAPGFYSKNFSAGTANELMALYPEQQEIIKKMSFDD